MQVGLLLEVFVQAVGATQKDFLDFAGILFMLGVFSVISGHSQQRRDGLHAVVAVVFVAHLDGVRLPPVAKQRVTVGLASWATPGDAALASQSTKGGQHGRAQRYLGQGHIAVHAALGDLFAPLAGQRGKWGALDNLEANVGRGFEERHHNLEGRVVEGLLQALESWRQICRKGALLGKQHSRLIQIPRWVLEQAHGLCLGLGQGIDFRHARLQRITVDRLAAPGDQGVELHAVEHALEELVLGHEHPARQGDRRAVVVDGLAKPLVLLNAKASRADRWQSSAALRLDLAHQVAGLVLLERSGGQVKAFNHPVAQRLDHGQGFVVADFFSITAGHQRLE